MLTELKAVFFDLDQTLTDRSASILKYAHRFKQDFAASLGDASVAELAGTIEQLDALGYAPRLDVFRGVLRMEGWISAPPIDDIHDHWMKLFPKAAVGREGLHDTLAGLQRRGYRLGIVTNGRTASQRGKVAALAVDGYLESLVISAEIGFKKPDSRVFHAATRNLGLDPDRCAFVGDHPINDVIGAQKAGLSSIWFEGIHEWPRDVPPPNRKVAHLEDLLNLSELQGAN